MNTQVTVMTTGRVTADLELKTSQNAKNTKYVQFTLALDKGFGDKKHSNFYQCITFGHDAESIVDAKVRKGSLITIVGDLDMVDYTKKDGTPALMPKITLYSWSYAPTSKAKPEHSRDADSIPGCDEDDSVPTEDCGENGLPFN